MNEVKEEQYHAVKKQIREALEELSLQEAEQVLLTMSKEYKYKNKFSKNRELWEGKRH